VRHLLGQQWPEARAVIETAAGEEGQVHYGSGPMVRHTHSGKYRRTRMFVLTPGCSRKAVRLAPVSFRESPPTTYATRAQRQAREDAKRHRQREREEAQRLQEAYDEYRKQEIDTTSPRRESTKIRGVCNIRSSESMGTFARPKRAVAKTPMFLKSSKRVQPSSGLYNQQVKCPRPGF